MRATYSCPLDANGLLSTTIAGARWPQIREWIRALRQRSPTPGNGRWTGTTTTATRSAHTSAQVVLWKNIVVKYLLCGVYGRGCCCCCAVRVDVGWGAASAGDEAHGSRRPCHHPYVTVCHAMVVLCGPVMGVDGVALATVYRAFRGFRATTAWLISGPG